MRELEDISSMPDNIRRHLIRIIGICESIDSHNLMRESQRTGSGEDSRILTIKNVEEQIKREPTSHLVSAWLNKIEALRMAIQQNAFDQEELPQLMHKLNTHTQKDIFPYFKDHSLIDFWNHGSPSLVLVSVKHCASFTMNVMKGKLHTYSVFIWPHITILLGFVRKWDCSLKMQINVCRWKLKQALMLEFEAAVPYSKHANHRSEGI